MLHLAVGTEVEGVHLPHPPLSLRLPSQVHEVVLLLRKSIVAMLFNRDRLARVRDNAWIRDRMGSGDLFGLEYDGPRCACNCLWLKLWRL